MTVFSPRLLQGLTYVFLCCACLSSAISVPQATVANPVSADTLTKARETGRQKSRYLNQQPPKEITGLKSDLVAYQTRIQPILQQTCESCHSEDIHEGNFRIDTLNPDLQHGEDADWWTEVLAVLSNGEMPPPDDVDMPDRDRALIVDWLSNEIQVASRNRRASGQHTSFRRMTRYEMNYALQDLLGLPFSFTDNLPPEANSEDGFQNSSELLQITAPQLESFRSLARKALMRATVHGDQPPVTYWGVTIKDASRHDWAEQDKKLQAAKQSSVTDPNADPKVDDLIREFQKPHSVPYFKRLADGRTTKASWSYGGAKYANKPTDVRPAVPKTFDHIAILPKGHRRFTIELGNQVPDAGTMRVRVRAARSDENDTGVPTLQLLFGWQASNEGRAVVAVPESERRVSAPAGHPEFYEWNVPLGEIYPRNSVRKTATMGSLPSPSEYIRLVNSSVSQGPIRIEYVEVAAPVYDEWPPASHTKIFFDSPNQSDETRYVAEVIGRFMNRAWRRPVTEEELNQKIRLYQAMRPLCETLEETVVEVLATVLASPDFLYLSRRQPSEVLSPADTHAQWIDAHELASRLAMFLWASLPDQQLRQCADDGSLLRPEILEVQVNRMLADERARRFSKHFVQQWLNLQLLEFRNLQGGYKTLKQAMQQEPVELFHQMLTDDSSVLDFLHSDYAMANERLANHYGIREVKGNHFRKIDLPVRHRRGGLLTQAGLLTMNAAGDDSHPLKRSIWLLESLLNDPPPPPPPAVPEIDLADPEIAKMTLKEQIENHRNHAACMSCHIKIDPWGIAFENYDSLGRWRTHIEGKPVDSTSVLLSNQRLEGMLGLKSHLLQQRQDQFLRALVYKLTTYALGRPLTFADRAAVDDITVKVRQKGDGLATMIRLIVKSELFRSR